MKLNAKDYEYFKKALLDQKAGLLNEANKTVESELGVKNEELADTVDRSTVETDRNFTLRLRDRERKLLKKVDDALERLEKGELGDCIQCDKRIGINRLRARPVATLCIDCKEEQEQKENQFG
ncbi:C4-type zinc finger protein, DksA/TraR family [hydrothermal vent metagenome]|uniref:C4-type zinc finger protein, DksA/TraR family n=1 Tax=hydrothermal vent metagenome TaxID=652676 RepID=A0A3B1CQ31_9ZZZZ